MFYVLTPSCTFWNKFNRKTHSFKPLWWKKRFCTFSLIYSLVGFSHVLKTFRFTFYILYDPDNLKRRMVANGNDFQISLRSWLLMGCCIMYMYNVKSRLDAWPEGGGWPGLRSVRFTLWGRLSGRLSQGSSDVTITAHQSTNCEQKSSTERQPYDECSCALLHRGLFAL